MTKVKVDWPTQAFLAQILSRSLGDFFLQGCEIKSGQGRPGFEAKGRLP